MGTEGKTKRDGTVPSGLGVLAERCRGCTVWSACRGLTREGAHCHLPTVDPLPLLVAASMATGSCIR